MEFEYDEDKNRANVAKHGVDFELAALIFRDRVFEAEDTRHDYGEKRVTAFGYVGQHCLVVVFTRRAGVIRIISARWGGRWDRRKSGQHLAGRD